MDYRWDDVRLFLALYRERTLAAAGARLKLDGSTMSRRLTTFEEALGRALFERTRDGLVPTAAAAELLAFAEEMERAGQRFAEHADALDGAVEGLVKLTTPPVVAEAFVVPQLPALLARHPGLRIDLDTSQRRLDLARGEADIAVRDAAHAAGDVVVTRLIALDFALLASPALAAQLGTVTRYDAVPWISWGDPVSHLPAADWLRAVAPGAEPLLRSSSLGAQLAAANAGLGAVVAARVFAQLFPLVPLAVEPQLAARSPPLPRDELWLATARSRRAVPRVAAVWDFLRERARVVIGGPA